MRGGEQRTARSALREAFGGGDIETSGFQFGVVAPLALGDENRADFLLEKFVCLAGDRLRERDQRREE